MRRLHLLGIACLFGVVHGSPVRADEIIGSGLANAQGHGEIRFNVETDDPDAFVSELRREVRLECEQTKVCGARVESIELKDGICTIDFGKAPDGQTITALLPDESRLRAGIVPAGAGGTTQAAYLGAGAIVVTGGVLGGLAAAGEFSGDDHKGPNAGPPTGPPSGPPAQPPGRPPSSPPGQGNPPGRPPGRPPASPF